MKPMPKDSKICIREIKTKIPFHVQGEKKNACAYLYFMLFKNFYIEI